MQVISLAWGVLALLGFMVAFIPCVGALNYLRINIGDNLLGRFPLKGIARSPSATPAAGSHKRHKQEQAEILRRAFDEKV